MKLLKARIQNFKSIDDSGWVDVDQVTCLVGKTNPRARPPAGCRRWQLNPVAGQPSAFDYELEYPRKRLQPYERVHHDDPAVVVQAVFELTDQEVAAIEEQIGEGALTSRTVTLTKTYDNTTSWTIPRDETAIVKHLLHVRSCRGHRQERRSCRESSTCGSAWPRMGPEPRRPPRCSRRWTGGGVSPLGRR